MNNLDIYNKYRAVPKEAQKPIQGGRLKGMTDINPMWRIKALTEEFGAVGKGWYYEVLEQRLENGDSGVIMAFVTINLFVKYDEEWSKPIVGLGGSSFVAKEKTGLYTSDECFKMAFTDALGIACKSLGIGANVWWDSDRSKYDVPTAEPIDNGIKEKTTTQDTKKEAPLEKDGEGRTETGEKLANEKQLKFMFSLAKQKNYTDNMKFYLQSEYSVDNSAELTNSQVSKAIKFLQEMEKGDK